MCIHLTIHHGEILIATFVHLLLAKVPLAQRWIFAVSTLTEYVHTFPMVKLKRPWTQTQSSLVHILLYSTYKVLAEVGVRIPDSCGMQSSTDVNEAANAVYSYMYSCIFSQDPALLWSLVVWRFDFIVCLYWFQTETDNTLFRWNGQMFCMHTTIHMFDCLSKFSYQAQDSTNTCWIQAVPV